jgi:hypothetical protein
MEGFAMFQRGKGTAAGATASAPKLHSIAGRFGDREIAGEFEANGVTHEFSFAPASVAVADGKIELVGTFAVGPGDAGAGKSRQLTGVRATLASTQGGIGEAPVVHRELLAATAQGAKTGTPDVQEAGHPKGEEKPETEGPPQPAGALPVTEATGPLGFVGVMYLRLSPLDARALGVAADTSAVQLNTRLAPTSERERELHWLFSGLVAAVLGERPDPRAAAAHVDAINRLLKG